MQKIMKMLIILISLNIGIELYPQDSEQSAALKTKFQRELEFLHEQYDFPGATRWLR